MNIEELKKKAKEVNILNGELKITKMRLDKTQKKKDLALPLFIVIFAFFNFFLFDLSVNFLMFSFIPLIIVVFSFYFMKRSALKTVDNYGSLNDYELYVKNKTKKIFETMSYDEFEYILTNEDLKSIKPHLEDYLNGKITKSLDLNKVNLARIVESLESKNNLKIKNM